MEDNSLYVRGKFINKLSEKVSELNNHFALLGKVDKKIAKKSFVQKGGNGADLKALQVEALRKKLQVDQQNKKLGEAIENAKALTTKLDELNAGLKSIEATIQGIDVKQQDLSGIKGPDVAMHSEKFMKALAEDTDPDSTGFVDEELAEYKKILEELKKSLEGKYLWR